MDKRNIAIASLAGACAVLLAVVLAMPKQAKDGALGMIHVIQEDFVQGIKVNGTQVINNSGQWTGAVNGTTGTFSGAVSGTTGTFTGAVSGTTGTFTGAVKGSLSVSGTSFIANGATVINSSGNYSGGTGAFTGAVDVDGALTASSTFTLTGNATFRDDIVGSTNGTASTTISKIDCIGFIGNDGSTAFHLSVTSAESFQYITTISHTGACP